MPSDRDIAAAIAAEEEADQLNASLQALTLPPLWQIKQEARHMRRLAAMDVRTQTSGGSALGDAGANASRIPSG